MLWPDPNTITLGSDEFPLYRFCYDYFVIHTFDNNFIQSSIQAYHNYLLYQYDGRQNDADLNILGSYYRSDETTIFQCLQRIEHRLDDPSCIPFHSYGYLAYYLVVCGNLVDFDSSECKKKLLNNLHNASSPINIQYLLFTINKCDLDEDQQQLDELTEQIKEALHHNRSPQSKSDYIPEHIFSYCSEVYKNSGELINTHKFISCFDLSQLSAMLFQCNAAQIDSFRDILWAIYRYASKGSFVDEDLHFMEAFLSQVEDYNTRTDLSLDKVVKLQFEYLCDNLKHFISLLSGSKK